MVKVQYLGRTGNNMFQYALGRIIAEEKGYFFDCQSIKGFENTEEKIEGTIINNNYYITSNKSDQFINFENIKNHQGGVFVQGYYQRYEYYQQHKDKIKKWFQINNNTWDKPTKNDFVVHIRLGDYLNIDNNYLGFDFYYNAIKNENFDKCYIVAEDPNHKDILKLKAEGLTIINNNPIHDYYFINNANKILISHSTFSWWAAWLSDAETICFPVSGYFEGSRGFWSDIHNYSKVDLFIKEDRIKKILV